MRRALQLAILVVSWLPLLGGTHTTPLSAAPAIHVFSCQVMSNYQDVLKRDGEIGLAVRFKINSASDLASIVWRAPYEFTFVDFIDNGPFTHSIRTDSYVLFDVTEQRKEAFGTTAAFSVNLPTYMSTEDPENCTVVRTISKDGTLWENPAVSQAPPQLTTTVLAMPRPLASPGPAAYVRLSPCTLWISNGAFLQISFSNQTTKTIDDVVFRAAYESGALEFDDRGVFAPNVVVKHSLTLRQRTLNGRNFYIANDPTRCQVARVHFTDGTSWQNAAAAEPAAFPTAVPNSIGLPSDIFWKNQHGIPTPIPTR